MEPIHVQGAITYLDNNNEEYAEIILDNGTIYTTRYMKLMEDMVYATVDHIDGKDVAIIPCMTINHIVVKNSEINKVMGFPSAKII